MHPVVKHGAFCFFKRLCHVEHGLGISYYKQLVKRGVFIVSSIQQPYIVLDVVSLRKKR